MVRSWADGQRLASRRAPGGRVAATVAPVGEPVTVEAVKQHIRQSTTADDVLVGLLIGAGRRYLEDTYGLAFLTQTLAVWYDAFPEDSAPILLPRTPIASVSTLQTYDTVNVVSTVTASTYFADLRSRPARIGLAAGSSWPTALRALNAVVVTSVAGWGAEPADVPEHWRVALCQLVAHWFEHPEAYQLEPGMTVSRVPATTSALLRGDRVT